MKKEIKNIRGAIFDMDGTLTDSMYIWDIAGETYLKNCGKTPAPDLRERLRPLSLTQAAELFRQEYGLKQTIEQILEGFNRTVEHEYQTNVTLKPGVLRLLQTLKKKGVAMSVATSSPKAIVTAVLERLGILSYFSYIITCGEVGLGKDHPAIYNRAAALMKTTKEDTVIFEDALHAITTASSAGYYVVGVYDRSEGIDEDKIIPLCSLYLKSMEDFPYSLLLEC